MAVALGCPLWSLNLCLRIASFFIPCLLLFLLFQRQVLSTYILSLIVLPSCVVLLISFSWMIWSKLTHFPSTSLFLYLPWEDLFFHVQVSILFCSFFLFTVDIFFMHFQSIFFVKITLHSHITRLPGNDLKFLLLRFIYFLIGFRRFFFINLKDFSQTRVFS